MCFEPDEVRRILSFKAGYAKDQWYKIGQINPPEENIMTILEPDARKQWKKRLLPAVLFQTPSSSNVRLIFFSVRRQGHRRLRVVHRHRAGQMAPIGRAAVRR